MMRAQKRKTAVLVMLLVLFVLSANVAFALGGGGGGGDGRLYYTQPSGANTGSENTENTPGSGSSFSMSSFSVGATTPMVVSLPEPITVLLIGSGLMMLAGLRRKFRK